MLSIVSSRADGWVVRCSCSWQDTSATRAGAVVLGEHHVKVAPRPPVHVVEVVTTVS